LANGNIIIPTLENSDSTGGTFLKVRVGAFKAIANPSTHLLFVSQLHYTALHNTTGHHWYPFFGGKKVSGEDLARIETLKFLEERPKDKPFAVTVAFYPPKPIGVSSVPVSNCI